MKMKIEKIVNVEHLESDIFIMRRKLRNKMLRKLREHLMNEGSDLGYPGIFRFDQWFQKNVIISVKLKSDVPFANFLKSLR